MPLRSDVTLRIAQLDRVSPDVVARISVVISEKLKTLGEVKMELHGGPRSVAEILNRMEGAMSDEILAICRTNSRWWTRFAITCSPSTTCC